MKRWLLVISSTLLVILLLLSLVTLHGHGERSYRLATRQGNSAVSKRDYRGALNDFQVAHSDEPRDLRVDRDLAQIQSYVSGNYYFNRYRLALAAKNYRRASKIDSLAPLNRRSLGRLWTVNHLRYTSARFVHRYDQALVLNHRGEFKTSAQRLGLIIKDPYLNNTYFRKFRIRLRQLWSADHQRSRSRQITTSLRETSGTESFKLKAPGVNAHQLSRITIAKARREIEEAGVNAREMSNGDVANVIQQARQHHSSVGRYAKKNY